jgi:hypothetical protein
MSSRSTVRRPAAIGPLHISLSGLVDSSGLGCFIGNVAFVAFVGLSGLVGLSCGDLEVRGVLDRVVGERVTLKIVEGDTLSGDLSLRAVDGALSSSEALKTVKQDDRSLSFIIPPDIAPGRAVAIAGRAGSAPYEVPLQINRLALALDERNTLEALPLPPATIKPSSVALESGRALLAMTPEGGSVVVCVGDRVRRISLGAEIQELSPVASQEGIVGMVGLPGGALVVTGSSLVILRFEKDQPPQQFSTPFVGGRALASNPDGTRAAALSSCDTDGDNQQEDCLTPIRIENNLLFLERPISLDSAPSATVLSLTTDGKGAVVADGEVTYGVWFGETTKISRVPWLFEGQPFTARPVGVDHALGQVSQLSVDLFAVAEQEKGMIVFLGFNPSREYDLQRTSSVLLKDKPSSLSFGRRTTLYVAAGNGLLFLDAGLPNPTVLPVDLSANSPIAALRVQP